MAKKCKHKNKKKTSSSDTVSTKTGPQKVWDIICKDCQCYLGTVDSKGKSV